MHLEQNKITGSGAGCCAHGWGSKPSTVLTGLQHPASQEGLRTARINPAFFFPLHKAVITENNQGILVFTETRMGA